LGSNWDLLETHDRMQQIKIQLLKINWTDIMQKQNRSVIFLLIILALLVYESFAENRYPVKSTGETTIAAKYPNLVIQVKIATHEVDIGEEPSENRRYLIKTNCTYTRYPCSIVDYIDISVNGKPLYVSRSVFSDLADLNKAEIRADKDSATLILDGGDASVLKVSFNAKRVKSRTLIAGEFDAVVEKTTYFQVVAH
jgi:hypothetical protein